MSGHTPGPWIVDGVGIHALVRAVESRVIVAVRHRLRAAENEANMRLIAAAPDLLEALRWAMRQVGPRPHRIAGQNDRYCDEYARAEAAIAKATGGTP